MYRIAIGIVLLGWAQIAGASGVAVGVHLTNVELMQLVVRKAVAEAMLEFPDVGTEPLILRSREGTDIDWIVENVVLTSLGGRGIDIQVVSGPKSRKKKKGGAVSEDSSQPAAPPTLKPGQGAIYPEEACRKGFGGYVIVQFLVTKKGRVTNKDVAESSGELFTTAVEEALSSFEFEPARDNDGKPMPSPAYFRFDFAEGVGDCADLLVVPESVDPAEESPGEVDDEPAETPYGAGETRQLTYRVSELEFDYPRAHRRFWFGPRRVERFARARIDFRLQNGENVRWSTSVEQFAADEVPGSALDYLESSQYSFARPDSPSGSARFWEPAVVAGVVGGLVALFYTNQAGD